MKILVIDDLSESREVLLHFLKKNDNNEIIEADCATSAEPYINNEKFDLIFCDMFMPNITGLDFLDIVRNSINKSTTFILTTGNTNTNIIMKAVQKGIDSYLSKPFDEEEMLRKVNQGNKIAEKRNKLSNK